uniref:Uncharacterized protein n=1 Tax=Arion vulgaris TaxID=1028688 RepID=A0A0B7AEJ2_9EUPU
MINTINTKFNCTSLKTINNRRRWKWIDHVRRMTVMNLANTARRWTAVVNRKPGPSKQTWRRTGDKELKDTWEIVEIRQNKNNMNPLCEPYVSNVTRRWYR